MAKFFRFPWASSGDKTAIPDATDVTGLVSYQQGYGADYQRDPATDPLAKRIERDKMNQLYNDITGAIQQYQTHGFPEYITAADNGGTAYAYDLNAIVLFTDGKLYINTVAGNTNAPDVSGWVEFTISGETHAATSKTTPVDADELPLVDSAASNALKKLTWANLKTALFASPALTGTPTAPTPSAGDNSTKVATTEFANSLLYEYTVTGSAVTNIDISGLDLDAHKRYRIELRLSNATASGAAVYLYVNGDYTATNYYFQVLSGSGSSVTSARANYPEVAYLDASSDSLSIFDLSYMGIAKYPMAIGIFQRSGPSASMSVSTFVTSKTAVVTNVTSLRIASTVASAIAVGSIVRIYRGNV